MSTSLPKSAQWILKKLALLPYDVDIANELTVGGTATFNGGIQMKSSAVTASGSSAADAAALKPGLNVVAGADDSVGVILPTAPGAGTVVVVKTTVSGKALKVYPDTSATINAISSHGAISMASLTSAIFIASSPTQWYTVPLLPS
jgi:hypothetical protein